MMVLKKKELALKLEEQKKQLILRNQADLKKAIDFRHTV